MAEADSRPLELVALVRGLGREPDLPHVAQRVVDTVAAQLGAHVSSSVSVVRRRDVETPAASDQRAVRADQLQYELGQGPCLDAISTQRTCAVEDLTADDRYPEWSRRAASETGIRSALSVNLFVDEASSSGR
ncbi:GAF domain-containing protein [Trujillonella humicola]|uniref:GAF domain-containing protein n=1 Tax=Trujillonella humicola TaxID=3383699 RepID=UPI0039063DEF